MGQPLAEIEDMVWKRLGMRRWLLGRGRVATATAAAVRRWPTQIHITSKRTFAITRDQPGSPPVVTDSFVQSMTDEVTAEVRSDGGEYGSFWLIVLSAVIGQIVRILLEWWLERRENQESMADARRNLEAAA